MILAHKIRLNPTTDQATYFAKAAGTKRFVFNWALDRWKSAKDEGQDKHGPNAIKKEFNSIKRELFPWVLDVAKDVAEGAFSDLGKALNNYFSSKGLTNGKDFPSFKSKKSSKQSFCLNNDKFKVNEHQLYVPKLGWVNMTEELRFTGKIMGATISKTADWWFVSISVEMEDKQQNTSTGSVGVDVGIKTLATLSDGKRLENQKPLKSQEKKYKLLCRSLSRKVRGSNRWFRTKRKLSRLHYKIACQRSDMLHKASHYIASNYGFIGVEDLNTSGMLRNRKLSKAISDVGFGEFIRQIIYKSERFGSVVVKVGRFFASSKTCSDCGHVNRELQLSDRRWICSSCGVLHDRDWNASKNIEIEALRLASV